MKPVLGLLDSTENSATTALPEPRFIIQPEPWVKVFLRNFADVFGRHPAPEISFAQGVFWPDVFVKSGLPWSRFLESAFFHFAALALVWGAARFWPQPRLLDRPALSKDEIISYSPSEYLPPLDTGDQHVYQQEKGEPEYAPQPIISVPPETDNRTQTIVTPPDIKLTQDVLLPNIVAWTQIPGPVPLAAQPAADMRLPNSTIPVVAPPPEVADARTQARSSLQPSIVAPPPAVYSANTRSLGDINIGHSDVIAPAPRLPVPEQRAFTGGSAALP